VLSFISISSDTHICRSVAALDQDPASDTAQALAARWKKLVGGFTGGSPQIAQGLNKMYSDRDNWPAQMKEQMSPYSDPRVWEFMGRAMKCSAIGG